MKRQCIKCFEFKEQGEFSTYVTRKKKRARKNRCRICEAKYKRSHYDNDKDSYLARAKAQREKDPEAYKEYLHKYYDENREGILKKSKEYTSTRREEVNARHRKYTANNKDKSRARSRLMGAIRSGTITRPKVCSSCNEDKFTEAHHHDYLKPYDVVWLCKTCHWKQHSKR